MIASAPADQFVVAVGVQAPSVPGVLAVHDDDVRRTIASEDRHGVGERPPTGFTDDITEKRDPQSSHRLRARRQRCGLVCGAFGVQQACAELTRLEEVDVLHVHVKLHFAAGRKSWRASMRASIGEPSGRLARHIDVLAQGSTTWTCDRIVL